MIRVGINGLLGDAIYKSRALQCFGLGEVHLFITPTCRPLLSFFRAIPAVDRVTVDEKIQPRFGHGEESAWSVELDWDTTYPHFPSEWVPNFLGHYLPVPRLGGLEEWMGSFREVLARVAIPPAPIPDLYLDIGYSQYAPHVAELVRRTFPALRVFKPDYREDFLVNMAIGCRCLERVVNFSAPMVMFSVLGADCLVDLGPRWGLPLPTFACGGGDLQRSENVFGRLAQRLLEKGF